MITDHHAYKRASKIALIGLIGQFVLAGILLFFGLQQSTADTPITYVAIFTSIGLFGWIGLAIVFYQHKLERLEALEEEELSDRSVAMFSTDVTRPFARRLQLIHRFLIPILSLIMVLALVGVSFLMLAAIKPADVEVKGIVNLTPVPGWGIATTLLLGLSCFIFSRFIAGMSKIDAWSNLRAGSGFMVANALLLSALAVGMGFRFFDNDAISESLASFIPFFSLVVAIEISLNLILNLYRPRIPGEIPRAAFDSKLLSLLAAPDNLVRSVNEAINYQFGFDVTSTWGYQLLLRRGLALVLTGVGILLLLSCLVIVNPNEQGVVLRFGKMQGQGSEKVINSGPLFKLPWPIETVVLEDVTRVRKLPLTFRYKTGVPNVSLWADDLSKRTQETPEPFLVSMEPIKGLIEDEQRNEVSVGLVDLQVDLHYVINPENNGLIDWLQFSNDAYDRRRNYSEREKGLRSIAQQVLTRQLLSEDVDALLSAQRSSLSKILLTSLQKAFDMRKTGARVLGVDVLQVRPAGDVSAQFEEVGISRQDSTIRIAQAKQRADFMTGVLVGHGSAVGTLQDMLDRLQDLRREQGGASRDKINKEIELLQEDIESILLSSDGEMGLELLKAQGRAMVETLQARARATRVAAQAVPYDAAPRLFRQRALMLSESNRLRSLRKYLMVADPSQVSINMKLQEVNPLLNFGESLVIDENEELGP